MESSGIVRTWSDEKGWGVLDSPATPGGCWAHFSMLAMPGFRTVAPGDRVDFSWEPADQDGYAFRAIEVWPAGADRTEVADPPAESGAEPGSGFRSTLWLSFDREDEV